MEIQLAPGNTDVFLHFCSIFIAAIQQWSHPKWCLEDEEANCSVGNPPCFALGRMMRVMEQRSEGMVAQTELAPRRM